MQRAILSAALLGLVGAAGAQPAGRRQAPAAEPVSAQKPLTEQARELLAEGRAVQALSVARRAAQENEGDYKAHYYIAFALMELGEGAAASQAVERSLQLARTPEAKAAVEDLKASMSAQGAVKDAETAAAEGLHAKAGRLYLQAWEKGLLSPEKTLVAADLFQNQLKDGGTAARMLRDLPMRHVGTPVADEATRRLIALRPALKDVADAALANAAKLEPGDPDRARWLQNVIEADADNQTAQLMLTNDAAETLDWPRLEAQLKLLQRRGWLQALIEGKQLSFGKWQNDTRLQILLADIWGDKRGAELLALNKLDRQPLSAEARAAQGQRLQAQNMVAFDAAGLKAGSGAAFRDCAQCPELVWVPPGALPQRDPGGSATVAWLNKVRISYPLAVGKYEVSFDEWDLCVADGGCRQNVEEGATAGKLFGSWGRGKQPLVNVTWNDARDYVQWLQKKTGEQYRLLSMVEYTYSARAGRTDSSLGAGQASCTDCAATFIDHPMPVGSFPANAWGLHDMIGNVKEMVADCRFPVVADLPTDGSAVQKPCSHRAEEHRAVLGADLLSMGGHWLSPAANNGVPVDADYERLSNNFLGFRVARTFTAK